MTALEETLLLKIILEERRLLKTLNPTSKKMRFDETFCPLSFFKVFCKNVKIVVVQSKKREEDWEDSKRIC